MKRLIILTPFFLIFFISCDENIILQKPFYDSKGAHVGDSLFINKLIKKIIFIDTSYTIDSIIFNRYENSENTLKNIRTFRKEKNIFENIDYFENGNIKKYSFIDEDNKNYFYERLYNDSGKIKSINGYLFFQGYVTNINTENLEIKKGQSIDYKIYYPNPPDCNVKIYIKYDDGTKFNVFKKSPFINFLQTVSNDNTELGTYKVNILLELMGKNKNDSIIQYNHELFYKVVK